MNHSNEKEDYSNFETSRLNHYVRWRYSTSYHCCYDELSLYVATPVFSIKSFHRWSKGPGRPQIYNLTLQSGLQRLISLRGWRSRPRLGIHQFWGTFVVPFHLHTLRGSSNIVAYITSLVREQNMNFLFSKEAMNRVHIIKGRTKSQRSKQWASSGDILRK